MILHNRRAQDQTGANNKAIFGRYLHMTVAEFLRAMVGTSPIEMIAVACGLANVLLIIRRSMWNFPFGLVMVVLYGKIFFEFKLYSDVILQVYFFVIQLFAIVWWLRGQQDNGDIIVRRLPPATLVLLLPGAGLGIALIGTLMARFTDASLPFWDAGILVLSVIAQTLLARRFVENWFFWIATDILAIGVFLAKGLGPTAALYAVFLGLALWGLFQWRQAAKRQGLGA
jgi:nicotinamide mononucleotide transporter